MNADPLKVPPFGRVPSDVFMDRRLTSRHMRVLGILYAHANKTFVCWLYLDTLVGLTGIDRRDLQRTLRSLEQFGWLQTTHGVGRAKRSTYRLLPPRNHDKGELCNNTFNDGEETGTEAGGILPAKNLKMAGNVSTKGGSSDQTKAGKSPTQNRVRTNKEHTTSSTTSELMSGEGSVSAPSRTCCVSLLQDPVQQERFTRFWIAYPKSRGKLEAVEVWKSIAPDEFLIEKMLSVIEQAKGSHDWHKNGGQFIPYPAKWLRAYGWEDDWSTRAGPIEESQNDNQFVPAKRFAHERGPAQEASVKAPEAPKRVDNAVGQETLQNLKLALHRTGSGMTQLVSHSPKAEEI